MYDVFYGQLSVIAAVAALIIVLFGFWMGSRGRANQQILLLQEIAEQQRQQIALLKVLVKDVSQEQDVTDDEHNPALSYTGLIPER